MDDPVRPGRWSRVPWPRVDEVLALGYALPLTLLLAKYATGPVGAVGVAGGLLAFAAPIALRRRRLAVAAVLALGGAVVVRYVEPRLLVAAVPALVAVIYLAGRRLRPASWLVLGATVLTLPSPAHRGGLATLGLCYVTAFAIGAAVGGQRRATERALTAQARAAQARLAEARAGVAEDRLRLARELHDVIAHSLSVITVQAGFARLVMTQSPGQAETALGAIEDTGRGTLVELRTLLGVLRTDDGAIADTAPTPTLADLPALMDRTALAGVAVQLRIDGTPRTLPAGIELCAYRLVQEALTNVARHSGATSATVDLDYGSDELIVRVGDQGRGAPPGVEGHGLRGMRERVRLYRGSLSAGPDPDGGFVVTAHLPTSPAPVAQLLAHRQ